MSHPIIKRAEENIGALKIAIRKERGILADYLDRIETGRGGFPEAGLRHGADRCEHNLKVLKGAILKERETIAQLRVHEEHNSEMTRLAEGFEIEVEAEAEGEGEG